MATATLASIETRDTTRRMVGITTAYSGPTDTRGSKIIVRWADDYAGNSRPVGNASLRVEWRDEDYVPA